MEKNIRNQKGNRGIGREIVRPVGGERGARKTSATHRLYLKRMETERDAGKGGGVTETKEGRRERESERPQRHFISRI